MNNKNNLQFKRLFILDPEYYKKLSESYEERRQLNDFETEISDILFNKNLNDTQKYFSLINNLSKNMNRFKRKDVLENKNEDETKPFDLVSKDILKTMPVTETKNTISTQTQFFPKNQLRNKSVQTDAPEEIFETKLNPPIEEIFEHQPDVEREKSLNTNNDVTTRDKPKLSDFYLEEKLHELAQKYSKEPKMNNIVLAQDYNKVYNSDFRVFVNKKTDDLIAVEVKPVFDLLYLNTKDINWKVTKEKNKNIKGQYIVVSATEGIVPLVENKQKRQTDNVLEKTLQNVALSNASPDTLFSDLALERHSIDKDFRVFKDKKTGKKFAVEVAPVYDHLTNKTKSIDIELDTDTLNSDVIVLRSRKVLKTKAPPPNSPTTKKKRKKSQKGSGHSVQWTLI